MKLKILLGGNGLIGKELQNRYLEDPENYILVIDKNIKENESKDKIEFICLDLMDSMTEQSIISITNDLKDKFEITEITVHLLSAILGPKTVINDDLFLAKETQLSLKNYHLLENIAIQNKELKIKSFFYSTSEVYGETTFMRENNSVTHKGINKEFKRSRYQVSKIHGEYLFTELAARIENLENIIIRPFNIVGKNQRKDFVIPLMIDSGISNNEIVIHGDGFQTRSFMHVSTFVDVLITIDSNDEIWINLQEQEYLSLNIGNPANTLNINDLAKEIQKALKIKLNIEVSIKHEKTTDEMIGQTSRSPVINKLYSFYPQSKIVSFNIQKIILDYLEE